MKKQSERLVSLYTWTPSPRYWLCTQVAPPFRADGPNSDLPRGWSCLAWTHSRSLTSIFSVFLPRDGGVMNVWTFMGPVLQIFNYMESCDESRELPIRLLFLVLPNLLLTWRAYATTALAHLLISILNLFESRSFSDFPGSIDISLNEKHRSDRLRFAETWSSLTALLVSERVFLRDMLNVVDFSGFWKH